MFAVLSPCQCVYLYLLIIYTIAITIQLKWLWSTNLYAEIKWLMLKMPLNFAILCFLKNILQQASALEYDYLVSFHGDKDVLRDLEKPYTPLMRTG